MVTNDFYLCVQNSAWGNSGGQGPPAIDDIRLSLRDSDPIENELINNYDFDLAEICQAIVRPVLEWNETPPPMLRYMFNSCTFPFRGLWLTGIHLYLFQIAEEHYRRNHLPYSAGGLNVDDKNRHPLYNQAWKERSQEWKKGIMAQKITLNVNQGWVSIGSQYPC